MATNIPIIYHMLPATEWHELAAMEPYAAATLATEGFIHCTRELDKLLWVANHFYRKIAGEFVLLEIAPDRLHSELRWEEADGHQFPHVYGPINRDAIERVIPFPRDAEGTFLLPNL